MAINSIISDAAANSLGDVAGANAYFAARGIVAWAGADVAEEVKAQLLIRGMDYLLNSYRGKWCFERASISQSMPFPAKSVIDGDGKSWEDTQIPVQAIHAQYECAKYLADGNDLLPMVGVGGKITGETVVAGPATSSTTYAVTEHGVGDKPKLPVVESLLLGLVKSSGGGGYGSKPISRG